MTQMFRTRSILPLLLLPVFLVLHGYVEYYPIVPIIDSLEFILIYQLIGVALSALCRLTFANWKQANTMAFVLMSLEFFFGVLQDTLKSNFPGGFIYKYSVLIPILIAILVAFWLGIRRHYFTAKRNHNFLIATLIALCLFDLGTWVVAFTPKKNQNKSIGSIRKSMPPADSLPDVHLIIADEYPGALALRRSLNYSNDSFLNSLRQSGFYVADSATSNYNFTEFSTASILNMDYLKRIEGREVSMHHLGYCFETIKQSPLLSFFKALGYQFNNHSIFDFNEATSPVIPFWLPGRTKLISNQTLTARLQKDIGYHFFTDLPWMAEWFELPETNLRNNQKLMRLTLETSRTKTTNPTFTYTHLLMPHVPYYYTRSGELRPRSEWGRTDTAAFFEYLEYTNHQLLNLVDSIQTRSVRPVAILLIGDHGLRTYPQPVPQQNHFLTLVSVLLPDRNYSKFYPTISHVNLLRTTVNSLFGESLPLLKDSTIFLRE